MAAKTHTEEFGNDLGNEDELNLPAGETTLRVPPDLSVDEMLAYFEPLRLDWMEKHYDAEARRKSMNPKRFRM